MRGLWICLMLLAAATARAEDSTGAFDKAYAESFYDFDACGDGVAGRIYRSALAEKLKQCPFSAAVKQRFQVRATAQRRKSNQTLAKLIEDNGGLPVRLEGMTRTCREQIDSPEYHTARMRLDDYAAGRSGPDAVIPQQCDAAEITP